MEKIRLPNRRVKGLHLYCQKHLRSYYNNKSSCNCNELVYRVRIYVPKSISGGIEQCKIKTLSAQNDFEASIQALEFEQDLKKNNYSMNESNNSLIKKNSKPVTITDCIDEFLAHLKNENVPFQYRHELCESTLRDFKRIFRYLRECLANRGFSISKMRFHQINEMHAGYFCEHISEVVNIGPHSYNNALQMISRWYNHIRDTHYRNLTSPFDGIERKITDCDNVTIEKEEFNMLLNLISPENGIAEFSYGKRNFYRPWLKNAIRMYLHTGARRGEMMYAKWSDIVVNHSGVRTKIVIEHFKINRIFGYKREKDKLKKVFYITPEVDKLLIELGYEKYKNQDRYILATDENASRKYLCDLTTRAFSHFSMYLNSQNKYTLGCLRNTFLTRAYSISDMVGCIMGNHTKPSTFYKNYADKNRVGEEARKDFSVF